MRIGVLCSANSQIPEEDKKIASRIFSSLARTNKYDLVLGGSSDSMMKDCCLIFNQYNNHTISIVAKENRQYLKSQNAQEVVIVKDTTERTKLLAEKSDVIIAMFGGIGSLREITTFIDMKREKEEQFELILYNENSHYDQIINWLYEKQKAGYLDEEILSLYQVVNSEKELFKLLKSYEEDKYERINNGKIS